MSDKAARIKELIEMQKKFIEYEHEHGFDPKAWTATAIPSWRRQWSWSIWPMPRRVLIAEFSASRIKKATLAVAFLCE